MFFFFAKSIWGLASPLNLTVIGLCLGTILLWSPWRRFGAAITHQNRRAAE